MQIVTLTRTARFVINRSSSVATAVDHGKPETQILLLDMSTSVKYKQLCLSKPSWHFCSNGALQASLDCAKAFGQTASRNDLKAVSVPELFIRAESVETFPVRSSAPHIMKIPKTVEYKTYLDAPHRLFATRQGHLNKAWLVSLTMAQFGDRLTMESKVDSLCGVCS